MQDRSDKIKENVLAQDLSNLECKKLHKKINKIKKKWKQIDAVVSQSNGSNQQKNKDTEKEIKDKSILGENTQGTEEANSKTLGEGNAIVHYKKKKFKTPPPHEIKEGEIKEFIALDKLKRKSVEEKNEKEAESSVKFIYHKKKKKKKMGKSTIDNGCDNSDEQSNIKQVSKTKGSKANGPGDNPAHETIHISQSESINVVKPVNRKEEAAIIPQTNKSYGTINKSDEVIEDFLKHVSMSQVSNPVNSRLPEETKKNFTIHNHESNEILQVENKIANMFHNAKIDKMIDKWLDIGFKEKKSEKKRKKPLEIVDKRKVAREKERKARNNSNLLPPLEEETLYNAEPFTSTPKRLDAEINVINKPKKRKIKEISEREDFFKNNKSIRDNNLLSKKKKFRNANVGTSLDLLKNKKSSKDNGVNDQLNGSKDRKLKENVAENVSVMRKVNSMPVKRNNHGDTTPSTSIKRTIDLTSSFDSHNKTIDDKTVNKSKSAKKREETFNNLVGHLKEQYGVKKLTKLLKNLSSTENGMPPEKEKVKLKSKSKKNVKLNGDTIVVSDAEESKQIKTKQIETIILSDDELQNRNGQIRKTELSEKEIETVILNSDVEEINAADEDLIVNKKQKKYAQVVIADETKNNVSGKRKKSKSKTLTKHGSNSEKDSFSQNLNSNSVQKAPSTKCVISKTSEKKKAKKRHNSENSILVAYVEKQIENNKKSAISYFSENKKTKKRNISENSFDCEGSLNIENIDSNKSANLNSVFSDTTEESNINKEIEFYKRLECGIAEHLNSNFAENKTNLKSDKNIVPSELKTVNKVQTPFVDKWEILSPQIVKFDSSQYSRVEETTWIKYSPISIKGENNSDLEFSPPGFKYDIENELEMFDKETLHVPSSDREAVFENDGITSSVEDDVIDIIEDITFYDASERKNNISPDIFCTQ